VTRELRVAIDLRPLALPSVSGVGLHVAQVLEGGRARGVRFHGVSDREIPPGRIAEDIPVAWTGGGGGRIRWEWGVLPRILRDLTPAPDLYHATWNHGLPRSYLVPAVLTLHDLIPWKHPEATPWPRPAILHQALYRRAVTEAALVSKRIVAVSETTRRDLASLIPGAAARAVVIPNTVPRWFRPAGTDCGRAAQERYAGGRPYWLYLGGFDPRKGIGTLLEAMARAFPADRSGTDRSAAPLLVLAGAKNEIARREEHHAHTLHVRVAFPGYVPDDELPDLFAGASLFLYPSRYEGFGIPPLLALAAGVPCVVSDGGSLPEVVGEAGIVFPAGDVNALAAILQRAAADPATFASQGALGPARAARFNPGDAADRMIRVYEETAGTQAGSS